ncbi:unnamed protein product [Arabis nemorensis]|uniref:Uncharacterized protein n=1 Tax=Arabis nemorensis TaxID=586526 RepID=A0A565CCR1_9BRAS|nr:unnamed protein product [Arabis nemorensis]
MIQPERAVVHHCNDLGQAATVVLLSAPTHNVVLQTLRRLYEFLEQHLFLRNTEPQLIGFHLLA